ncbi:MFS transporter [Williamsia sp.]|uniref:MFS transporter n=1 Tax=Williamsia sp. TaxID=1872085 RepID=UPI002F94DC6C
MKPAIPTSQRPAVAAGALPATIFLVQFLVALDVSLVNIALPDVQTDLGFGDAGLQWVVSAYLLTFAGFMLIGGRLGDLWGRRSVVLIGLSLFAAASVLGGFAWDPASLLIARGIQGLAGALLAPAALALVTTLPEGKSRSRAMGFWGAAGAGGGAVGVVLSGLLTDAFSWRAVMFVNLPIVVIALIATWLAVDVEAPRAVSPRLDVLGACLATAGVGVLVYAVTAAGEDGWGSTIALGGFAAAAVLLAAFVGVEARTDQPLMPLHLFRRRSIVGANVFGFMLAAGQLAAFYFASLYIQNVWGVSTKVAGFMFLPFCGFVVVGIVIATKMAASIGPRSTLAVLGLVGAAGLAGFSLMPAETAFWTGVLLPSVLGGIGIGGSMVVLGAAATSGVDAADAGVASGVLNASRQLGGTIGLAVLVTIAASATASSDAETAALAARGGYATGLAVGALFLVVGALAAYIIIPRNRK